MQVPQTDTKKPKDPSLRRSRHNSSYESGVNVMLMLSSQIQDSRLLDCGEAQDSDDEPLPHSHHYFNVVKNQAKMHLEFESDVQTLAEDLAQKWQVRQQELAQQKHEIQNQKVTVDLSIRSMEEQKRQLKGRSELQVRENDTYMSSETQFLQEQLQNTE